MQSYHVETKPTQSSSDVSLEYDQKIRKAVIILNVMRKLISLNTAKNAKEWYENDKFKFILSAMFGVAGSIVALLTIADSKKNYLNNPYVYLGTGSGLTALWGVFGDTRSIEKYKLRGALVELIAKNQHLFELEGDELIIFKKNINLITFNIKTNVITLHLPVSSLGKEEKLQSTHLQESGSYLGMPLIEQDTESVHNKIGFNNDHVLYYFNNDENALVNQFYKKLIDELKEDAEFKEMKENNREMSTLTKLFDGMMDHHHADAISFEEFVKTHHNFQNNSGLPHFICVDEIHKFKVASNFPRCMILAFMLEKAQKEGLLKGKFVIENRNSVDQSSHEWISYFFPGKDKGFVIDTASGNFGYPSMMNSEFKQFYNQYYMEKDSVANKSKTFVNS